MRESLDRLRLEVGQLRASRKRLVVAADADRRKIERELHDGPQQDLVAVAVKLQLASRLVRDDPGAATALLEEMRREVREALDGTRKLANRVYPTLLEAGGLGVALRSAAASAGVPTRVDVAAGAYAPEIAGTVYFCCVEALERIGPGASSTVTVRDDERTLMFEVVEEGAGSGVATADWDLALLRDRVEALGGRLTVVMKSGQGTRLSGSLPTS